MEDVNLDHKMTMHLPSLKLEAKNLPESNLNVGMN